MNDVVINVKSVSKAFDNRSVLRDIAIDISAAQAVLICGINGAGKTTLLRIIAGLLQPDQGSVELCGYNIRKDPEKESYSDIALRLPKATDTAELELFQSAAAKNFVDKVNRISRLQKGKAVKGR